MQAAATFQHPNTRVNQMWPSITGGDLTGANLTKANLVGANLTGADLTGTIFCYTKMPDGTKNNSGC